MSGPKSAPSNSTTNPTTPLGSVLVTGGCGFLGSHIVSLLVSRYPSPSTTVAVLDLNTSRNVYSGATYHSADLTSPDAVRAVLNKVRPSVVIHTASPVAFGGVGMSSAKKKRAEEIMRKVNVDGTRVLLEETKKAGCEVFVYTSSASVISDTVQDLINADEKWMYVRGTIQKEFYSDTKAEAEHMVLTSNTRPTPTSPLTFLTCAIRPSAMFGEQDVQMIPNILAAQKAGRTGWQLGDGDNLFDYTYVGNTAHAHLLAATRLLEAAAAFKANPPAAESEPPSPAIPGAQDDPVEPADPSRVDGQPFIITNCSPVYFWDFTRAVWAAYARRASPPQESLYPVIKPRVMSRDTAIFLARIAETATWLLGRPAPTLTQGRVRYACMTRYFRTKRARLALWYYPIWTLDEGLERTVEWFMEREREEAVKKGQ